jgi:proliferating cell nuclear antigen
VFSCIVDADVLKKLVKASSILVDEAKIRTSSEGISMRAVDSANVAMVSFELKRDAFELFEADESEIGVDLHRLEDVLELGKKGDKVSLSVMDDEKLRIKIRNLSYTLSLIDPSSMRRDPRVPNLEFSAEVWVNGMEVDRAIKAASKISDHIVLGVENEVFYMEAEGDTDSMRLELTKDELLELKGGNARSMFSLDYLSDMSKSFRTTDEVRIYLGTDYPVKITFPVTADGEVSYLLAPRIESE